MFDLFPVNVQKYRRLQSLKESNEHPHSFSIIHGHSHNWNRPSSSLPPTSLRDVPEYYAVIAEKYEYW
jgi:hypothetical protein